MRKEKPEPSPIGRPMIYAVYLMLLRDDLVYSPGAIAHMAHAFGFMEGLTGQDLLDALRRVRHSLNRFRINHGFPEKGDGRVKVAGQAPAVAWTGKRWKAAITTKAKKAPAVRGDFSLLAKGYPDNVKAFK